MTRDEKNKAIVQQILASHSQQALGALEGLLSALSLLPSCCEKVNEAYEKQGELNNQVAENIRTVSELFESKECKEECSKSCKSV